MCSLSYHKKGGIFLSTFQGILDRRPGRILRNLWKIRFVERSRYGEEEEEEEEEEEVIYLYKTWFFLRDVC